jgi:hypothetical protein
VFGALLDARRGGHWSLCPAGGRWRSRQRYVPDTNVLVTHVSSDEGELEIQDLMPVGATPGTLVRRVAGVRGEPHLVMEVEPPGFRRSSAWRPVNCSPSSCAPRMRPRPSEADTRRR